MSGGGRLRRRADAGGFPSVSPLPPRAGPAIGRECWAGRSPVAVASAGDGAIVRSGSLASRLDLPPSAQVAGPATNAKAHRFLAEGAVRAGGCENAESGFSVL